MSFLHKKHIKLQLSYEHKAIIWLRHWSVDSWHHTGDLFFSSLAFSTGIIVCPLVAMRSILTKSHLSLISLALSVGINRKVIVSLPTKLLKTNGIRYNSTPRSDSNGSTDPSSNHKCVGRHHLFFFFFFSNFVCWGLF